MKYFQHIEKSGSQYVGYAGGKVWTIHQCMSADGKWHAFNQHNVAEDFYAGTLTAMDAIFQTVQKNPPFQTIQKPKEFAIAKARPMLGHASDLAVFTDACKASNQPHTLQLKLPVHLCLALTT